MTIVTMIFIHDCSWLFSFSVMQQQQTSVYPNMMPNQQQNVYNQVGGNPTLSRAASQTPIPMSNQQWSTNQPMSVSRTPQQQQQQQQQHGYNQVWTESVSDTNIHLCAFLDDATGFSTAAAAAALCHSTTATTTTALLIRSWRSNGFLLFFFVVISVRYNCFCSPPSIDEQHLF